MHLDVMLFQIILRQTGCVQLNCREVIKLPVFPHGLIYNEPVNLRVSMNTRLPCVLLFLIASLSTVRFQLLEIGTHKTIIGKLQPMVLISVARNSKRLPRLAILDPHASTRCAPVVTSGTSKPRPRYFKF